MASGNQTAATVRDRIKELRRVKASELRPNPRNWRTHDDAQRAALAGILEDVGYADALIAYETPEGLQLIDGHLRADMTPDQEVPVLVLDLTEAEADKMLVSLDPLASMAGRDEGLLRTLLDSVETEHKGLRAMLTKIAPPVVPSAGLTNPDAVPDAPEEPITKPGDLWVLGDHWLLCGDATSADDVARLLDGATPFIMVTDPPYGVSLDPSWRDRAGVNTLGDAGAGGEDYMEGGATDVEARWDGVWALTQCAVFYVWCAGSRIVEVHAALTDSGLIPRQLLVWDKGMLTRTRSHYWWSHEHCIYGVRKGFTAKWKGEAGQSTIIRVPSPKHIMGGSEEQNQPHPAQKPVECMRRPIGNHGGDGDHVYDPFLGSGTTIIACEQLGRRCYALEIEPKYVDVAVQRWEEFTGKKAERV